VFVWTLLLVMPENLDSTATAGRPNCVSNHIHISTDDMCYGVTHIFAPLGIWRHELTDAWGVGIASISAQSNKSRVLPRDEKAEKAG
jgi:hypothetical protein